MEETKQKKLSQPFVPIPVSFLNEMIANETAPLSHRVLAVILRQMFDTRKKEQDKLTVSYIIKTLHGDKRNTKRAIEQICKHYSFVIENNGQGKINRIRFATSVKNDGSKPPLKMTEEPPLKMTEEPPSKMTDTIEYRIEDSIERKRIIEITGDEWC